MKRRMNLGGFSEISLQGKYWICQDCNALKTGDDDAVCANYVSAENNYKLSQNCAAPQLNGTIMQKPEL